MEFLFQKNEHHSLVDALSYIDPLPVEAQNEVKKLVTDEMSGSGDRDRCSLTELLPLPKMSRLLNEEYDLPQPLTSLVDAPMDVDAAVEAAERRMVDDLLRNEMNRIAAGLPFRNLTIKEDLEPPAGPAVKSVTQWMKSVETAKALLEHQNNKLVNLDLSLKFAKNGWLKHISDLEVQHISYKRRSEEERSDVEDINKRRKLVQVSFGNEMRSLTRHWQDLVDQNHDISKALASMAFKQ
eukprot:Lankesteria_metandrocarpae@DN926_c0_g1_i1.p1